jgi:hypothetical protein
MFSGCYVSCCLIMDSNNVLCFCAHILTGRWLSHNQLIAPIFDSQLTCLIRARYLASGQTSQKIPSLPVLLLFCVYPLLWKRVYPATTLQQTISSVSIISPFWCHVTIFTLIIDIFLYTTGIEYHKIFRA